MKKLTKLPCAGNIPTTPMPNPNGSISDLDALQRMQVFRIQKNKKRLTAEVIYDPCGFLDLLMKLNDTEKKYSGLRIYLAAEIDDIKELTLVFVPTNYVTENGKGIQKDDIESIYMIEKDKAVKIGRSEAAKYIHAYQDNHLGDFTKDGLAVLGASSNYQETTNLWYDIALFQKEEDVITGKTGMQGVLQYLIDKQEVDQVVVNLAAFDHTPTTLVDFFYHIMLIFNFYQNVTLKATFSGKNAIYIPSAFKTFANDKLNKVSLDQTQIDIITKFLASLGGFTDTGVPCPPPPPGKTCDQLGALLP